jgi:hypothetical protein
VYFHCQVCAAFKVKSIFIARKCGSIEVCAPVFEVLPPVFKVKSILMARYGNLGACAKSSDPRGFQQLYNQPKNSPSNAREISLSLGAL